MENTNIPTWLKPSKDGCLLVIKLQPRSSKNKINFLQETKEQFLKINVTAPPVDNEANQALIKLLSEILHVPKSAIQILHGTASRLKTVFINGKTPQEILNLLKSADN